MGVSKSRLLLLSNFESENGDTRDPSKTEKGFAKHSIAKSVGVFGNPFNVGERRIIIFSYYISHHLPSLAGGARSPIIFI